MRREGSQPGITLVGTPPARKPVRRFDPVSLPLVLSGVLVLSLIATVRAPGRMNVPSPLAGAGAGIRANATAAVTPRRPVLLVVIDGLREDMARTLPGLRTLASRGASAEVEVLFPSMSSPGYVAFLTGVGPEGSGRRNNEDLFPTGLDSLVRQLAEQGRRTRVISDEVDWWWRLAPEIREREVLPTRDALSRAEAWMDDSDLLIVHLCGVDDAGHRDGAASDAYRHAALTADAAVSRLAARWGQRGAFVVTSDHGHVAAGGHGGVEPEVLRTLLVASGPGVARGGAHLRIVDVAPTLAAWLGVPAPAQAEGRASLELLDAPAQIRDALSARDAVRLRTLAPRRAEIFRQITGTRRVAQLVRGIAVMFVFLFVGRAIRRRGHEALRGIATGLLALLLAAIASWELYGPPSLSAATGVGWIAVHSAVLGGAALALVTWVALRRARTLDERTSVLVGVAASSAVPAAVLFVLEGAFFRSAWLPGPTLSALPMYLWPFAGVASLLGLVVIAVERQRVRHRAH